MECRRSRVRNEAGTRGAPGISSASVERVNPLTRSERATNEKSRLVNRETRAFHALPLRSGRAIFSFTSISNPAVPPGVCH